MYIFFGDICLVHNSCRLSAAINCCVLTINSLMSFEPNWDDCWDVPPTDLVQPDTYIGLMWSDDDDHYISCVVFCGPYPAA